MELAMSQFPPSEPGSRPIWLRATAPRPAPDFARVARVQAYWERLRDGRVAPQRSEVDPGEIADHLEVMFVAEMVAPGIARFRLAGQQIANLAGMEPRGMPLSCLFDAEARAALADAIAQVGKGARVILPLRADRGLGRPVLEGRLALMPLADAEGRINRILGALETRGQTGRPPRRFRLNGPCEAGEIPAAIARPPLGRKTEIQTAQTPQTHPLDTQSPEARRAGFRLIQGGA